MQALIDLGRMFGCNECRNVAGYAEGIRVGGGAAVLLVSSREGNDPLPFRVGFLLRGRFVRNDQPPLLCVERE